MMRASIAARSAMSDGCAIVTSGINARACATVITVRRPPARACCETWLGRLCGCGYPDGLASFPGTGESATGRSRNSGFDRTIAASGKSATDLQAILRGVPCRGAICSRPRLASHRVRRRTASFFAGIESAAIHWRRTILLDRCGSVTDNPLRHIFRFTTVCFYKGRINCRLPVRNADRTAQLIARYSSLDNYPIEQNGRIRMRTAETHTLTMKREA